MRAVADPDAFCPICGIVLDDGHRCHQRALDAIDRANSLAEDRGDDWAQRWLNKQLRKIADEEGLSY